MPDEVTQVQAPAQEQGLQEELTPESLAPDTVEVDIAPKEDEEEALTAEQLKFMPKEHQDAYNEKKTKYQTRINELTKKYREEERKRIELETRLKMVDERPAVQQVQQIPQQQSNPEQIIFQMKQAKREALSQMDFVKADEIQDTISTYQEQLREHKQRMNTTQTQIQAEIKNTLSKFQTETEWFNKASSNFSEPMAGYAAYLEYQLAPTWRGSYSELLSNIKGKVEQEFSWQKDNKEKKPISFIGGTNSPPTTPKTIKLSQAQRDVAMKMFGDSPDALKKYAQELYKIEGSGRAQSVGR